MDNYELLLKTQLADYQSMCDLLLEQKKLLLDERPQSMQEINRRMEQLFMKLSRQERMLEKFAARGENDEKSLGGLRRQVKALTEENSALAKNKLQFISFNINLMTCSTAGNSYGQGGNDKTDTKLKIFDQSV